MNQRVLEGENYKKDSERMKDFIQKQSVELEEYKRKVSEIDSGLQTRYHKSLKQIESMHKDNT